MRMVGRFLLGLRDKNLAEDESKELIDLNQNLLPCVSF